MSRVRRRVTIADSRFTSRAPTANLSASMQFVSDNSDGECGYER